MRRSTLVASAVAAALLLAGYASVHGTLASKVVYYAVGLATVAVVAHGVRRQGRDNRLAPTLLGLGVVLSFVGDVTWEFIVDGASADVTPADAFYLSGYVALGCGLWRMASTRGQDRTQILAGWIDGIVVFVAALAVVWQLSMAAIVSDSTLGVGTQLVWALYPALDAALIGLVFRLLVQRRRGEWAPLAVAAGAAAWLASDVSYLLGADAEVTSAWLEAGWMAGGVLLSVATLAPAHHADGGERPASRVHSGVGRLAVCLGALVVPSTMEAFIDLTGAQEVTGLLLSATIVLTLLVFARAALLVRGEADARARVLSQQRYSAALAAHSSDAVVVLSRGGRLLSDPSALPALFQIDAGQQMAAGDLLRGLGLSADEAHVVFRRALQAAGEVVDAELMCVRGGVSFWIGVRIADLTDDPDVGGVVVHVTDITDRKRAEEALAHQAFHDDLTGLANRALFADRVDQALRRGARGQGQPAVVYIDLDGFKGVNDTLGHPAGDSLLRQVAARLRSVVRADDTVARLGGDEFAVLVEQTGSGPDEAAATAERVLAALAPPVVLDGQSVTVSGSVGIAVGGTDATSDSLLGDADIAMYAAKVAGRGRSVVFDSAMRDSAVAARELEQELQGALVAGEFRLVYQPVVDLADGSVTGFEALLRWDSPTLGAVPPDRFVPVAEASGLIEDIGAWVLREACATAAAWRAEHRREVTMAVNVSAVQLTSPHLVEHITEALTLSGLTPSALVLEVTETALVADPDRASDCLAALRALGLRLALDDFGTGYSSLAHLRQFTVDVLKIDRSFVATIGEDGVLPPIVRGMIDLGRTLGLEIVAEGVETEAQHRLLGDARCDLAQGYLFARPLERADASLLLLAATAPTGA